MCQEMSEQPKLVPVSEGLMRAVHKVNHSTPQCAKHMSSVQIVTDSPVTQMALVSLFGQQGQICKSSIFESWHAACLLRVCENLCRPTCYEFMQLYAEASNMA